MLALLLAFLQPLTCSLLQSDRIYGRDLAAAVPALAALTPDMPVGLAPAPGQQRIFSIPDLKRIAVVNHLSAEPPQGVCFAWKMSIPDRSRMISAMQQSLEHRDPTIQIVESSLMPAPDGKMMFPLSGLIPGSDKPSVWRGYVEYAEAKRFPIWARVLVTVKEQHVVAAADLREGDSLDLDRLQIETYDGPVRRENYFIDPTRIAGLLLRRPIPKGTALLQDMLEVPREVTRGETVHAIIQTGAARLDVEGVAEADGRKGQIISVRNPRSGRSFHARVEEKGTVVVVPGGQFGLAVESNKS